MSRMKTGGSRYSFQCPDVVMEEFDEIAEAEGKNRSEKLRELVEEAVENGPNSSTPDEYLPSDQKERDVYEAAVEYAKKGTMPEGAHMLLLDRHDSQIAQEATVSGGSLASWMHTLEQQGFVRRWHSNPMDRRDRNAWLIKPRCADPEQWRYSRLVAEKSQQTEGTA